MPVRKTKRGAERTPLSGDADVLVCGASFAGLAVARELAGSGARVLVIDRYDIGERQTSACAAPTAWLERLGVGSSVRQTFGELVVHTPHRSIRVRLPWTLSTFDYPELCALLAEQGDFDFETAKVDERRDGAVMTDRGQVSAPLIVDALGWKRVLGGIVQPPDAPLSRGLGALEQELAQRRVVEGGERPRKAHAGGDVRGVNHELVEGLLDRPSGSHRVEPVRGRGARRSLALPDLVAIDDQDPGAGARQLACHRETRKARPADQHVAVVLQRCSLRAALSASRWHRRREYFKWGADFCHSYPPCPRPRQRPTLPQTTPRRCLRTPRTTT
jgi:hypothetical protein